MSIIPCSRNPELQRLIEEYVKVLRTQAHTLGNHGLSEEQFYNGGLFRGAIESIRGNFSATMRDKRVFARAVLNYMQDRGFIRDWDSSEATNRHDFRVQLLSGKTAAIELKGCLDGNNTTIFDRPANANEFILWSVCTSPAADPKKNAWSGLHTRLSAEIISRAVQVDGLIIWDMFCGTVDRPCPKLHNEPTRVTQIAHFATPPPCIYLFPATVPSPRSNPNPQPQKISEVEILKAFHDCFGGRDSELNYVSFQVEHRNNDTVRRTIVSRGEAVVKRSDLTTIRRR